MVSRRSRLGLLLAAALVLLATDQLTKLWAYSALVPGGSISLPGPVDLTLLLNRSNAFGIAPDFGEATRWMLAALNLAVASLLAYLVWNRERSRAEVLACAFIIAGGAGNAIDRIWLGAVIDMFDASEVGFNWVFNVADVLIDIGIGLWLLAAFSEMLSTWTHRQSPLSRGFMSHTEPVRFVPIKSVDQIGLARRRGEVRRRSCNRGPKA